jgi:branched-chain amino acid transport system ATP-binding protein
VTRTAGQKEGGRLSLRDLRKSFGAARVLGGVTLEVAPGQRHGLIGVNGAGKTTLFNVITGDLRQDGGELELDGAPLAGLSIQARALRGLGRTYQVSSLATALTVRANLVLALADGRLPSLVTAWRATGQEERLLATAASFGLEPVLDERVSALSHGTRRQLELAMVLGREPRVLLLDEPAAGLSPSERATLARTIRGLSNAVSLLMIEHDMDLILDLCAHITVLHEGRVLTAGPPAEIARDPTVRGVYLGHTEGRRHA